MTGEQLSMVDEPLPDPGRVLRGAAHADWRGAPETERQAAALIMPRTGIDRRKVLDAIAAAGAEGLTDDEISKMTGLLRYTAAPRRNELLKQGWIEDSGIRRKTNTGRPAAAWRLSERGRAQYRAAA